MRRRRRQSDTSEVALMAVMTKAMGAFLILMVFAMQYYIPDFTAEQIAAIVNRSIGGVRQDLASAVERMKKGDFTKEELAALQRQIEVSLAKLAQAEGDIARLQTRLDQSVSQLKRVEGERVRLEAEAHALKAEVARLKAFDPSVMQAEIVSLNRQLDVWEKADSVFLELKYRDCGDAIINLRVARRMGDGSASEKLIPDAGQKTFDAITRGPLRERGYDDSARLLVDNDQTEGMVFRHFWSARRLRQGEYLAVYAAYLNADAAVPVESSSGPGLSSTYCKAEFRGISTSSAPVSGVTQISRSNPFALVTVLKATERGLVKQQPNAEELRWFQQRIDDASCDSYTCAPDSAIYRKQVAALLADIYRARLNAALPRQPAFDPGAMGRLVGELLGRFENGSINQQQLADYAALATSPHSGSPVGTSLDAATTDAARRRLVAAAVPPLLVQEFLARASRGVWSADEFERRIRTVEKSPAPIPPPAGPTTMEDPGRMIALLKTMADTGFMTVGVATQWTGLVMQTPPSPPTSAVPAGLNRNEIIAQMANKGFPPEFASFVASRVLAGAIKPDDYANAMKVTKGNASR
jgi:hypothetical protein